MPKTVCDVLPRLYKSTPASLIVLASREEHDITSPDTRCSVMMVPISTDPISFPNANGMLFTSSPPFSTKKDASIALVLFLRKRDASYVMFQ